MTMAADNWNALHRHPELPWSERETAETIRTRVIALGIPWRA